MATIFQTAFSNAFSWMKMYKFLLRFLWSLFPRVQLTIFQVPSHYLNQWWLDYWHICAILSLNELIQMSWHLPERTDCIKGKHPELGGTRREITCWHQAEESDAEGGGFRRLMPASDLPTRTIRRVGVFLLYPTYLWNKQQVMSINLTTMQYHVVVDHVAFYVIHSQVRYNIKSLDCQLACLPLKETILKSFDY